jgi:hypothetical protein
MLIHLTKDISPLIKLSFNTPKLTRGLDALSIFSFLVIDDNPWWKLTIDIQYAFGFIHIELTPPKYVPIE